MVIIIKIVMQRKQLLPTVATLEAKNFKVKYDFLNFSQGTCMRTMTLVWDWNSLINIFLPLDSINKWGFNQILWVFSLNCFLCLLI